MHAPFPGPYVSTLALNFNPILRLSLSPDFIAYFFLSLSLSLSLSSLSVFLCLFLCLSLTLFALEASA